HHHLGPEPTTEPPGQHLPPDPEQPLRLGQVHSGAGQTPSCVTSPPHEAFWNLTRHAGSAILRQPAGLASRGAGPRRAAVRIVTPGRPGAEESASPATRCDPSSSRCGRRCTSPTAAARISPRRTPWWPLAPRWSAGGPTCSSWTSTSPRMERWWCPTIRRCSAVPMGRAASPTSAGRSWSGWTPATTSPLTVAGPIPFAGGGRSFHCSEVLRSGAGGPRNMEVKAEAPGVEAEVAGRLGGEHAVDRVCLGSELDDLAGRLVEALPEACHFYPRDALTALVLAVKSGGELPDDSRYQV